MNIPVWHFTTEESAKQIMAAGRFKCSDPIPLSGGYVCVSVSPLAAYGLLVSLYQMVRIRDAEYEPEEVVEFFVGNGTPEDAAKKALALTMSGPWVKEFGPRPGQIYLSMMTQLLSMEAFPFPRREFLWRSPANKFIDAGNILALVTSEYNENHHLIHNKRLTSSYPYPHLMEPRIYGFRLDAIEAEIRIMCSENEEYIPRSVLEPVSMQTIEEFSHAGLSMDFDFEKAKEQILDAGDEYLTEGSDLGLISDDLWEIYDAALTKAYKDPIRPL